MRKIEEERLAAEEKTRLNEEGVEYEANKILVREALENAKKVFYFNFIIGYENIGGLGEVFDVQHKTRFSQRIRTNNIHYYVQRVKVDTGFENLRGIGYLIQK